MQSPCGNGGGTGIGFDSQGNLYLANSTSNTVEKFDSSGHGTLFSVSGYLDYPTGLAIDSADNVFVSNNDGSIEEFNPQGIGSAFGVSGNTQARGLAFDNPGYFASETPEPGSIALLAGGLAVGLITKVRRRKRTK